MIERRRIDDDRREPSGNGIDASSPLPDKLCELERRISAALTEPRVATDLADLLEQTDWAVIAAEDFAKTEHETALDPTMSPDPHAARQRAEDAQFMVGRLKTLRPRLLRRYQQVQQAEETAAYISKRDTLRTEYDTLQSELAEVYADAASKLIEVFSKVKAFRQRRMTELGPPPSGVDGLPEFTDALRLLDKVQLFDFGGQLQTWPPHEPFAATFAQSMESMGVPPHPGRHWSDPEIQQRQRAELLAEQQHNAEYHEQAAHEQEERQNREAREQWLNHAGPPQ